MKNTQQSMDRVCVHIVDKTLLQPPNPVIVHVIGAGGTGSQVVTALARMNYSMLALGHPGLMVRLFDDDCVEPSNLGRQLFTHAEMGLPKAVALINRTNRFFGTNWKAIPEKYDRALIRTNNNYAMAPLTISCVDTVTARFDIAGILTAAAKSGYHYRSRPLYWIDFGNSRYAGQVILSTVGRIKQPASKKLLPVGILPMVTTEFKDLLMTSEKIDTAPSCSLAHALMEQDLFINSSLAQLGASLLWQLFREGILTNRGFFLNVKELRAQPLKISVPPKPVKRKKSETRLTQSGTNKISTNELV